jgi:hypothetical protein
MKWKELQEEFDRDILNPTGLSSSINGPDESTCREWNLRLMMEIFGALDQIAILQREQMKYVREVIAPLWSLHDERESARETRQLEAHALMIEMSKLAIEREKRMAQNEAENQKRWEEFQQLGFIKKPDDGTTN